MKTTLTKFEVLTLLKKEKTIKNGENEQLTIKIGETESGDPIFMEMMYIPAQTPYFMGKYPITNKQFSCVTGTSRSCMDENHPATYVSWDCSIEFCEKLSSLLGEYFRLPTEAEWEYACRAGTNTPFHFGETITTDLVNYDREFTRTVKLEGRVFKVDHFKYPNAFGLFQMHGNVWEWVDDVDGGCTSPRRIKKGGCPSPLRTRGCMVTSRGSGNHDEGDKITGFRIVLEFPPR